MIYPSIAELTQDGKINRYTLVVATAKCARIITDEYDHTALAFTIEYQGQPLSFRFVPVMVFRKHLPGRKLTGSLLPVVTAPGCRSALILPKRCWHKEFTALWKAHRI